MSNDADLLYFNGINAVTGSYDFEPMTVEDLAPRFQGLEPDKNSRRPKDSNSVVEGIDINNLAQTGWGVLFAENIDPAIREALQPLLDLRQEQAGDRFYPIEGSQILPNGRKANKRTFYRKMGAGPGPVDPDKSPYYLLIVGDPENIDFQFQHQMNVQYAMGRIHFDTAEEYANYAQSVVAAEKQGMKLPRQAGFFSVATPGDKATLASNQYLVHPLADKLRQKHGDWDVAVFAENQAKKAQLARMMGGDQTPALLFTASHGMGFPMGHKAQIPHQGALLCDDWPGPNEHKGLIPQDFFFAGDDIDSGADLRGLISFFFACYGGGTPKYDAFSHTGFSNERKEIAPSDFIANLPKKMLSHPNGGALATIGHVERAWGYSFMAPGVRSHISVFEDVMSALMNGARVGAAMEGFNIRYGELATELTEIYNFGDAADMDPFDVVEMWTSHNDARGYAIAGDPAVRLAVAAEGEIAQERSAYELITTSSTSSGGTTAVSPPTTLNDDGEEERVRAESMGIFGIGDDDGEPSAFTQAVRDFADKLGQSLKDAVDDAATLEVATYVSSDLSEANRKKLNETATLRAFTSIKLDGDIDLFVPETDGYINKDLLEIHFQMVQQAQTQRTEMLKTAMSLLDIFKSVL